MKIAVPTEISPGERRVALVPDTASKLVQAGLEVVIEAGAGAEALIPDQAYQAAGATILADAASLYGAADVVLKVQRPSHDEVDMMSEGTVLVALLQPLADPALAERMARRGLTAFSMDAMPRIARAQSMDVLSSMASIAGYKAALMAASTLGKVFPMMITAAGTFAPAKGLVIGAGVAGLQAIATARRLGAVVFAFDVRPVVKEQVQSLGATFVEAEGVTVGEEDAGGYAREQGAEDKRTSRDLIHRHIQDMDFVIATAAVPGARAPVLITKEMVVDMRLGSVIVDVAAESGGNCELTRPGEEVREHGILILGPLNLPSELPTHASRALSRNFSSFLLHLVKDGGLHLDYDDEITKACAVTRDGEIVHEQARKMIEA
jgi:NAD(P) transhydrogenase subunit alpha